MTPEKFLKELKTHRTEQYKVVAAIRELIFRFDKSVNEEIKYGGLLYSQEKPFGGLFVYKDHVSMEFSDGACFSDPGKLLIGCGKFRRHLKFKTAEDVNEVNIHNFLKQVKVK